jgi:hypothetical protein
MRAKVPFGLDIPVTILRFDVLHMTVIVRSLDARMRAGSSYWLPAGYIFPQISVHLFESALKSCLARAIGIRHAEKATGLKEPGARTTLGASMKHGATLGGFYELSERNRGGCLA